MVVVTTHQNNWQAENNDVLHRDYSREKHYMADLTEKEIDNIIIKEMHEKYSDLRKKIAEIIKVAFWFHAFFP